MSRLTESEVVNILNPTLSADPHRIVDEVLSAADILKYMPHTSRHLAIRTATPISCVVFLAKVGLYRNSMNCPKCGSAMILKKTEHVTDGIKWICNTSKECRIKVRRLKYYIQVYCKASNEHFLHQIAFTTS